MLDGDAVEYEALLVDPAEESPDRDIREILKRSSLPTAVKCAEIRYEHARLMDAAMIERLTAIDHNPSSASDHSERLAMRRKALKQYLGSYLTCVLIRLPGAHYTIEIDTNKRRIAHWEWQRT